MLIINNKYESLSKILNCKIINEAGKKDNALDLISKFLSDIVEINAQIEDSAENISNAENAGINTSSVESSLNKTTRVINGLIKNLIRNWSDVSVKACSEVAKQFAEKFKINFISKSGTDSKSDVFRTWVSNCEDKIKDVKNFDIEEIQKLIFIKAHSHTESNIDSFKKKCEEINIDNTTVEINMSKKQFGECVIVKNYNNLSDESKNKLVQAIIDLPAGREFIRYEHVTTVNNIRNTISDIVKNKSLSDSDKYNQIKSVLSSILICWISIYEDSRIPKEFKSNRPDPYTVYKNSGILPIYRIDNGTISDKSLSDSDIYNIIGNKISNIIDEQ